MQGLGLVIRFLLNGHFPNIQSGCLQFANLRNRGELYLVPVIVRSSFVVNELDSHLKSSYGDKTKKSRVE